jgi:hypothetical protein
MADEETTRAEPDVDFDDAAVANEGLPAGEVLSNPMNTGPFGRGLGAPGGAGAGPLAGGVVPGGSIDPTDPVIGSVVAEDWGRAPAEDPEEEGTMMPQGAPAPWTP